ncbi:NAD(P)-dependent alcohol dehydrogenase [Rubrivivax gelatinosus]|uniref:NAD(P)-dependent alcohol dehydrogenase n=1 Tax=Rubrivivax gelatinosus TaxID=28068 RepID=UPI0002DCADAF|nr:NAD(P)-dependent alcohol dehydrogenase [Rubrivivax gelatinosus]MBG6078493.1 putative zinc-type alcohol dehydrogenase-like protein [Rubrivivax gelatinosus]
MSTTRDTPDDSTYLARAWAARGARAPLAPLQIARRAPMPRDVQIEILYCGVCHSDLHYTHDDWHDTLPATYPAVPGHEVVGRVTAVGAEVTAHAVGDLVGVGCLVDSDRSCPICRAGRENFCPGQVLTYGSPDRHGTAPVTYGGYSSSVVVDEHFVLRVPRNLDLAGAAPLLCAGITTYSPLKRAGVGPGSKVGIVGLGGLGHMAVKLARAFGANVVVLTTSPRKADDARRLGAHEVIVSTDAAAMAAHAGSFDFILDTVSAEHDINSILALLKLDADLTLVGAPARPLALSSFALILGNRSVSGSAIGNIRDTQEMLDFCGRHGITADVEVIPMQQVNEAWQRLERGDVKYRFVIDMASLKAD